MSSIISKIVAEYVLNPLSNIIFQSIMSREFGEIEYNQEEYLNQGKEFEKNVS